MDNLCSNLKSSLDCILFEYTFDSELLEQGIDIYIFGKREKVPCCRIAIGAGSTLLNGSVQKILH